MIASIVLFSFIGAVTYLFLKDQAAIERFRKNIHQGDTVKCKLRKYLFIATVKRIPGSDCVIVTDLTYSHDQIVSIHSIYPL